MDKIGRTSLSILSIVSSIALNNSVFAQVIQEDSTLPNNSIIDNSQAEIYRIIGGTTNGNNLFHSFIRFSVDNGQTAYFDNAITIENIFTRVTGNSISNIDGIIKANGTANLFFLNPNGIVFTENARLDIGGSFIGSTANSITFSEGKVFSAINPQIQPLLSINLPTALQFTSNPNSITVEGNGHIKELSGFAVVDLIAEGLEVPMGKTLALIGGNINLQGGNLEAEAGRIELGSIQSHGNVNLESTNLGWIFNYEEIKQFSNITLEQVASINTTGQTGGNVQLQGRNIYFQDGSVILSNTEGSGNAGDVNIKATGLIEFTGSSNESTPLPSAILSETIGSGNGGNITATSKNLILKEGTQFSSSTFGQGNAGNITVNSDEIQLIGLSISIPDIRSGFVSQTQGSGNGGNITVNTNNLMISESAQIAASSVINASGDAGDIIINAVESINISSPGSALSSNAQSTADGDAGDITVNTKHLILNEQGQIITGTFFGGEGGNITINASESITLEGGLENSLSSILAIAASPPPFFDIVGTGSGGNITVTTSKLSIKDGAQINVSNFLLGFPPGIGNPGNISIKADSLNIDNGQIITVANLEDGGNINLDVNEISILDNQAVISATAGVAEEFGDGGNINFNSQFIVGSGTSEITAEAFKGTGGNINLKAEGLFFTPDVIISASSQLGADGEINIRIPDTQPIEGLIERQNLRYPQQIAVGCQDAGITEGSLIYSGKGGVPELSTDEFSADTLIDDLRALPSNRESNIKVAIPPEKLATKTIKEAQGWQWKDSNKNSVIFTSNPVEVNPQSSFDGLSQKCRMVINN